MIYSFSAFEAKQIKFFFHILAHSVLSGGRRLRLPEKSMGWLVVTLSFLKKATGNEAILHFQFSLSRRKKEKKW